MSQMTEFADLEKITYRLRLTALQSDKEKVYSELLNYTDSTETCDCVINTYALFGPKGVLDVLQTLEHLPRARVEFAASRSLKSCLDLLQELGNVSALTIALEMLHSAEVSSEQNLNLQGLPEDSVPDIVSFAAPLVAHDSLALSERSCQLIESLLRHLDRSPTCQTAVLDSVLRVVLDAMNARAAGNGTLRLRYCSIFARLLARSERVFNTCVATGVVDAIVQLVRNPDPLLQMTALDLLVHFAGTTAGMHYLFNTGLVGWLVQLAGGQEEGAAQDPYLGPDAVRCCAEILTSAAKLGAFGAMSGPAAGTDTDAAVAAVAWLQKRKRATRCCWASCAQCCATLTAKPTGPATHPWTPSPPSPLHVKALACRHWGTQRWRSAGWPCSAPPSQS